TYLSKIVYTDIYFAPGVYARLEQDPAAMAEVVKIVERTPGVAKVFRGAQVSAAPAADDDSALTALRYSRVADRSGDMFLVPRPYWVVDATGTAHAGTTHGTPHAYDRE